MNNISVLNQVFQNITQSVNGLSVQLVALSNELDKVKIVVKDLKDGSANQPQTTPSVDLEAIVSDVDKLKNDHGQTLNKFQIVHELARDSELLVRDILNQVRTTTAEVENLKAVKPTPSITTEEVQAMIDTAINSLIAVLTSASSSTSTLVTSGTQLPPIPEVPIELLDGVEDAILETPEGENESNESNESIETDEPNGVEEVVTPTVVEEVTTPIPTPVKKKGRVSKKNK